MNAECVILGNENYKRTLCNEFCWLMVICENESKWKHSSMTLSLFIAYSACKCVDVHVNMVIVKVWMSAESFGESLQRAFTCVKKIYIKFE